MIVATRAGLAEAVRHASRELHALGAPFTGDRLALNPAVLPMTAKKEMATACRAVLAGVDYLVHVHLRADAGRIADAFQMTELEMKLWRVCPEQDWALMARPDILIQHGSPKIVDINAVSNAAFFSLNDQLLRAQHDLPGIRSSLKRHGFRATTTMPALARVLQRGSARTEGVVAICYTRPEPGVTPKLFHLDSLCHELQLHGCSAHVCYLEDIEFGDRSPRLGPHSISCIYRFFVPQQAPSEALAGVVKAATAGEVSLFTAFRGEPLSSKISFAFLSDDEVTRHFPSGLRQRLESCVPWTRRVSDTWCRIGSERVDLLPWIETHQSDLVLKAAKGHGGGQVVMGREVSSADWRSWLTKAISGGEIWIVTRFIDPDPAEIVHFDRNGCVRRRDVPAVYGAFVLERRFLGAIRRYRGAESASFNVNGSSGAIPSPVHWHG